MGWDHFKGTDKWKPATGNFVRKPARGAGWGGVGNGNPICQFKPGENSVRVSPERRAELEARADEYFERLDKIAADPTNPQQLNAILALQRRVWGKEKESVEQTGKQTIIIKTGVPRADRD